MKKKLLLADDSVTIQKVVQITFSHDDYDLTVVDNGDIAYEKARAQRPDLILADVFMPGKNGYELCAAVKNDPSLAKVPVLLLTGTFEPFDEAKARSVGADRWIAKPFESQALIACVEELLTQSVQTPFTAPQVAMPSPVPVASPAPAEVALPDLSSDLPDDIWGSEFVAEEVVSNDEFPPLDAFAATSQDDLWDVSGFETESPMAAAESDDLWGNFDGPAVDLSPAPAVVASSDVSWEREDFSSSFAGDVSNVSAAFDLGGGEVPLADEVEILEEIDLFEPAANESADVLREDSFAAESFPFAEEMLEAEEVAGADIWSEPVPTPPIATPLPVSPVPVAPPVAATGSTATLTDAQLELIVERVAKVVISRLAGTLLEKIAWEVVPDLAETMIKEELRKIRESVAAD